VIQLCHVWDLLNMLTKSVLTQPAHFYHKPVNQWYIAADACVVTVVIMTCRCCRLVYHIETHVQWRRLASLTNNCLNNTIVCRSQVEGDVKLREATVLWGAISTEQTAHGEAPRLQIQVCVRTSVRSCLCVCVNVFRYKTKIWYTKVLKYLMPFKFIFIDIRWIR